jgi:microcystin-dependent protein
MTNYTKITNFAAKDSLSPGDANKKVKGSEIDAEFNAISTAVATKADTTALPAAVPSGAVFHFAMTSAPTGYLVCDGSAVSRSTYADLFTAIGTTFGSGDGSSTFNLPNLVGQFIRGYNSTASGKDASRVFGSGQEDAVTEHNHLMAKNNQTANGFSNEGESDFYAGYYKYLGMSGGSAETGVAGGGVDNSNETTAMNFLVDEINDFKTGAVTTAETETRPTNVALLACIKI